MLFNLSLNVPNKLQINTKFRATLQMTDFCTTKTVITACNDASDNKLLELAIDAKARLIVSGDIDLRALHPFQGVAIISPSDFIGLIK